MKPLKVSLLFLISILFMSASEDGCSTGSARQADERKVNDQQEHYQRVLPLQFHQYSIPREVLGKIQKVVTEEARTTFTVIETITGEVKYKGSSIGYGIPADRSFTNPLQVTYHHGAVVEQAEPDGLYSSKNTDGTWVLYVTNGGSLSPIYTEHKVTTYPFPVKKQDGIWVQDGEPSLIINIDSN